MASILTIEVLGVSVSYQRTGLNASVAVISTHPDPSDRLLIIENEYRSAGLPVGLRQSSAEFQAMKRAMRKPQARDLSSTLFSPVCIAGTVCSLILVLGFCWRRQPQTT
jgi:hypothetical protein